MARYWDVDVDSSDLGEAIKDIVDENVIEAIRESWEDDPPVIWVEVEQSSGRIKFQFIGPEKPGGRDNYSLWVDLYDELEHWNNDYQGVPSLSDAQKEDMRERSAAMLDLAEKLTDMAHRITSL